MRRLHLALIVLIAFGLLHDVAARAGRQHPARVGEFVVDRKYQDGKLWMMRMYVTKQLQAFAALQTDLGDQNVRPQRFDRCARSTHTRSFAAYGKIALALQQVA